MQHDMAEIVDIQNAIIHLQSDAIDALFGQLAQHLTVQELDALPTIGLIDDAVRLRADIDR